MEKGAHSYSSEKAFIEMSDLLEGWKNDPKKVKNAFSAVKDKLLSKKDTILSFKSRPNVSYSLRANVKDCGSKSRPLFALVDIIDDDPGRRWLSVCFYGDMITDPDELGDLIPGGLLGSDGYCFDISERDDALRKYVGTRIREAYENAMKS